MAFAIPECNRGDQSKEHRNGGCRRVDRKSPQKLYCAPRDLKDPIERGSGGRMQIPPMNRSAGRYGVSKTRSDRRSRELVALGYLKTPGDRNIVRRLIPDDSIRMAIHLNTSAWSFSARPALPGIESGTIAPEVEITDYPHLRREIPAGISPGSRISMARPSPGKGLCPSVCASAELGSGGQSIP